MRSLAAQAIQLQLDLAKGMEPEPTLALEEPRREAGDTLRARANGCRAERQAIISDSSLVSPIAGVRWTPSGSANRTCLSSLPYERSLSFPVPINNARLFLKLWRLRLESDLPKAPVIKVRMMAQPARPRALQGGLFAPLAPDPEKLELTLARIAAVVGRENVGSPEIPDTHRPHAFRVIAFQSAGSKSKSVVRRQGDVKSVSMMALRLFRPPVPVRVESAGGRPLRLLSSQVRGRITFAAGPWLKSGGWWEEEKWDREEWDIEIRNRKTPALYSIYYDRVRDEWYLQGEYD
jgi:protein ImuB